MGKLAWVLLPLLLAGAWVGWRAWRARLPPRATLNAAFSLLLMLYLLATAGLGIFWVATQHLPVFDWHYLFGYAMLLLLAVHLAFNLRSLWRHLAGPARRAGGGAAAEPARRPWLGALGVLGLFGLVGTAYWVGLRHGRTELRVASGSDGGHVDAGRAIVETFHGFSSHSRAGLLRRAASTEWGGRPPSFKTNAGAEVLSLPPAATAASPGTLLTLQGLASLLWHTAGISEVRGGIHFRAAPSSGALFASEFYLAARAVPGLRAGLWRYQPLDHSLVLVQAGAPDATLVPADAPAALIATAVWRRSGHKYGDRCYRYVLADLGHALENLCQTAAALGGGALLLPGFDETALAQRLRVDEAEEGVLAQALLHAEPMRLLPPRQSLRAAAMPPSTLLGVTAAIHAASSLRGDIAWATTRAEARAAVPPDPLPLIAARRSRRRYVERPLAASALGRLIDAMVGPPSRLSDAVRLHVITHAVQGRAPAAWHWSETARQLVQARVYGADIRSRSRAAALDQDVVGDAAAVFVLGIDRERFAADAAGAARGYRHAFIEAGLMGERLYLGAQALGLGVCAVGAFYDDEAAALAAVDPAREWIVHFAAVGAPA